ncbi:hypothetical protein R3P38DRAFT_3264065 [Favolaschia claudopus]|uniref:Nephrocystin 3-like N-terminal domain-containing protein n=1 Tax=Favolaschia claudopus TaxID=2862362 RepID=A0AAW0C4D4_9AGAR
MSSDSEQIASTQGQSQHNSSIPSASQDTPDDPSCVPSSLLGQHVPLSSGIVPHFQQSHSSPLSSTQAVVNYNINISGGTGGSGGSGNDLGGQGGFGEGPVFNNHHYTIGTLESQIEAAAMRILHEAAANEASHDSGESYAARRAIKTRERNIYLIFTHGTGKSAIAQSFCEQLHARGCLGGGFFFKRGHLSRGNAQKLFPTLAYQLSVACPEFRATLAPRVVKNPALVGKSLSIQLQALVLEPYRDAASNHPFVMVIDGLDECDGEDLQQQIMHCAMDAHSFDLRFLVVSRPESHIHAMVPRTSVDHLIIEGSFPDIQRYLVDEFKRIRTTHEAMLGVIHPWPGYDKINTLVYKSSGHFIYAATIIRFIEDGDWNPVERLAIIMGGEEPDGDTNSPFAALDQLYIHILTAVPSQSRLRRILAIASAQNEVWNLGSFSVYDIAQILQTTSTNIHLTLRKLRSVIWLPETDGKKKLFGWHHASFLDFLNNRERAGQFYVDDNARSSLAVSVIKAFCDPQCSPPSFEDRQHVTEHLNLNFITTTKLSSGMAKSLDCVNLDFFFGWRWIVNHEETKEILNWLKFHDAPTKLIQHWENIVYMAKFNFYLTKCSLTDTPHEIQSDELHYIHDICPRLLDIIQAYILFEFVGTEGHGTEDHSLRYIRWALNMSWQEMLVSIATACRYAGEDHCIPDTMKLIVNAVKLYRIRDSHPEGTFEVIAKRFLPIMAVSPWCSV